jgi:N-acetyl-gamma-glutamylphosphate reductase
MLSRKQQFRMICRNKNSNSYKKKLDTRIMQLNNDENEDENEEEFSIFDFLFSTIYNKKTSKSVSFKQIANVTLIPCSNEYRNANLTDDLWYSQDDLDLFKKIRIEELLKERQELQDPKYATL